MSVCSHDISHGWRKAFFVTGSCREIFEIIIFSMIFNSCINITHGAPQTPCVQAVTTVLIRLNAWFPRAVKCWHLLWLAASGSGALLLARWLPPPCLPNTTSCVISHRRDESSCPHLPYPLLHSYWTSTRATDKEKLELPSGTLRDVREPRATSGGLYAASGFNLIIGPSRNPSVGPGRLTQGHFTKIYYRADRDNGGRRAGHGTWAGI